jgi:hypothetical protein
LLGQYKNSVIKLGLPPPNSKAGKLNILKKAVESPMDTALVPAVHRPTPGKNSTGDILPIINKLVEVLRSLTYLPHPILPGLLFLCLK